MTAASKSVKTQLTVGGHALQVTNLDKVLWPRDGYTKGDLIAYYRAVAKWLLPHVRHRPLTLERYPNGIDEAGWWEKHIPKGLPEWVATVKTAASTRDEKIEFILCEDEATLTYVANLATIVLHVWYSHQPTLDVPDFILIDLDPGAGCTLATLARVALAARDELATVGVKPLVKTTGGSGLHVVIPLEPRYDWEQAKGFAELVARRIHAVAPDHTTLDRTIARRPKGTVYIDYVQVGKGKTYVAPFSVRPRDGAPVSMPIPWTEVEAMRRKRAKETAPEMTRWSIANVPKLLARNGDCWSKAWKPYRLEPVIAAARSLWS
ncbi:MAG: non-homologous end-joining DNA ligase [Candidatus Lustribacter sp.]|jgi:bifunctional non-homologous end joining protein LigD